MRVLNTLTLTLILGLLCTAPAMAQQGSSADDSRTLTSGALDAAVAGHESAVDQQRARLAEFLAQPQVRELARDRGIDMGRVEAAAAGLGDREVRQIAPLVANASAAAQSSMGTITISVAAVIIILLVLILVT